MPPGGEAADDQARIRRRSKPDRNVEAFVDDVDGPLAHVQIDLDVGIGFEELRDDRRDKRNDVGPGIDPQRAARRRLQRAGNIVGLLDIGQNLRGAIVIGPADFGQADLARGAIEKTHAKFLLQLLHMLADHARRDIKPRRGATVASATSAQLDTLFGAMAEVEATCARLAAMSMTPIERRRLQSTHEAMAEIVARNDTEAFAAANLTFHTLIYAGAHNAIITDFATALRRRLAPSPTCCMR